jgi:PKD repeat protein
MKTIANFLLIAFTLITASLEAENAPVTSVGIVTNAGTAPGGVTVPVTVKNFVSIGAFTLTLRYQANLVSYVNAAPHLSFPGMSVVNSVNGTLGRIVITWPQTPGGVTLPDETHLLDLTFTYISGTSALSWYYTGSNVCQYKKYSGGSYVVLNDLPRSLYYVNGGISNHGAPITHVPVISNPVPGILAVPVTVNNFTSIGAMSLTLEYNQSVLSFQGCTPHPLLSGTFNAGTQVGPNGNMILTISWFGLASLADGSPVATISFIYSNTNGSYSVLNWLETGSSCEYADAQANPLLDSPTADYYKNGAVYPQVAPLVWLPVATNNLAPGGISLPVAVNNFTNIKSFNLTFEYDPAVMTYGSFAPNPALGNMLVVTDSPSGLKRKVVISWSNPSVQTLPDGSLIANLNFSYHTGTSTLAWITTDATSCRFNDVNGNACYDLPKTSFYHDGLAVSHTAPKVAAANVTAITGQQVTVPVKEFHFSNIGLFSLTLDYDPAVLTWQSATLVPSIGGTFTASAAGQGRIVMNWSGSATSLADGGNLVNLIFVYNGGASPLAWFDDGTSCRFAETPAGQSLYDQPQSAFYINGYVGPDPLSADFTASATSGDLTTTISLNDLSTGNPTTWSWMVSPSTSYYVNGTNATSQNPQIRFTADGMYSVTLIVTRGTASSVLTRTGYITVGTLGFWTGLTSSDWFTGSNWQNSTVPPSTSTVFIPPTASHWPHLMSGFALGSLCKNITMEASAQMTVDGDLTINAGSSFTFTGAGSLMLGGNWSNSGIFNIGSSAISFTGPNNASVFGGTFGETFWKVICAKTNATVFMQGVINIIGTEN